ncbi:MAG: primosomal protein N', partial [Clostridiales bacterium]|nr:primosomal protein N' [Clostridiales bacterium]
MQYANIIIDISHENVDRVFQYRIPDLLEPEIGIGTQVNVPFGSGNRIRKGYVVEITAKADCDEDRIKEIVGIVPGSVTADSRLIALAWWMKERYGSTMNQALKTVLPVKRRVKARQANVMPQNPLPGSEPPALNADQRRITDNFCLRYDEGDRTPVLLHGVTGSGKTEVYMEMIRHVLADGKQVIVLIPEISLTWQTVQRFYLRFGERICVMHSRLSAGERFEQFERAKNGKTDIMIGARSALFTPFSDLGLIIMDEEHEGAYKSEMTPRYHAREVAEKLAGMHGAVFVMGSATPSLESYSRAMAGIYRLLTLPNRASRRMHPVTTEIVDLRTEMQEGNKSIFSRRLKEQMADRLEKKAQIMLFIYRRGYAGVVSCRSCGQAIK